MKRYRHDHSVYEVITGKPVTLCVDRTLLKMADLRNGYGIHMRQKAKAELVRRTLLGTRDNAEFTGTSETRRWIGGHPRHTLVRSKADVDP